MKVELQNEIDVLKYFIEKGNQVQFISELSLGKRIGLAEAVKIIKVFEAREYISPREIYGENKEYSISEIGKRYLGFLQEEKAVEDLMKEQISSAITVNKSISILNTKTKIFYNIQRKYNCWQKYLTMAVAFSAIVTMIITIILYRKTQ